MFIAIDKPDLSTQDSVMESERLMKGNRGKLFVLQLSFIGWAILATFTFGIGFLWLNAYIQIAIIVFYKYLSGEPVSSEPVVSSDN